MLKTINECVGCADGCHGCGRDRTFVTVCDECGAVCDDVYLHDTTELCEGCAEKYLDSLWKELTIADKLNLLCWDKDEFDSLVSAEVATDGAWAELELNEKRDYFPEEIEVRCE